NIVLPQASKRMVAPFINQSITQLKNTSLLYVVAVPDLMYTGSVIVGYTFRPLEVYTSVGIMYFAILYPLTLWAARLEGKQ
ncbi:MAG: amino acid ABC transporter permease, partial [Pseudorhodoplanes sp.]